MELGAEFGNRGGNAPLRTAPAHRARRSMAWLLGLLVASLAVLAGWAIAGLPAGLGAGIAVFAFIAFWLVRARPDPRQPRG